MPHLLSHPGDVTPAWLTNVLRREGALDVGSVTDIKQHVVDGNSAILSHLHITYSPGSSESAPTRLFLKIPKPLDWALEACRDEVAFYRAIGVEQAAFPYIIRCYDASYSQENRAAHLLLDDLSETHFTPVTRDQALAGDVVPSWAHLESMVDCVAHFHAHWWEHPSLAEGIAQTYRYFKSRDTYAGYIRRREREFAAFLDAVGSTLPPEWIALYKQAVANLPAMWDDFLEERLLSRKQITLTHCDCYFIQFLCPISATGQTYLGDWQSTSAYLPSVDLVHMFGIFWTPEQRKQDNLEERLLRRYHAGLRANGANNYTWEDLRRDYRYSVIDALFATIWDQTSGASDSYWRPKLERVTANYLDLNCANLF